MGKSSTKKNIIYQMIYEILILILPFATSPYISRIFGANGLGEYSYTYNIAGYFVLFAMLGIKNYGNRTIAKTRDNEDALNKNFSNILAIHLIVSVLCVFAYILYVKCFAEMKTYAAIQTIYVISAVFDISWFYFGIEKFKMTVIRSSIIKILNVVFIFVFVRENTDLWKYCLIMALGMFISQVVLWIPLKRYVRIIKPDLKEMKIHVKPLIILFIPIIAISLYRFMDKIMIGMMSKKTQLGYYENAEKVCNIPITIIASFGTVMLPKISNMISKSNDKLSGKYMKISMRYIMLLALALAFGLAGISDTFSIVFWGNGFAACGNIIKLLSITIPFIAFANILRTQYLIPYQMDKEYLISVILGAVVNVVVNYLLIPTYGGIGAAIGTISAEVIVCLSQSVLVMRKVPLKECVSQFIMFVPVGAVMFLGVYQTSKLMDISISSLFIQVIAGVVIYGIFSLIILYFIKDEIFMKFLNNLKKKLGKGAKV
ncbi:MAG: oligosaccharide flippase family protein [Ruminococcus sp.]|nr:oligosaccharide flippase family protein [Ruminococcus sp.]